MIRFLKEPLLHFLLLGACLFALFSWMGDGSEEGETGEIVVTPGRIENLASGFAKTWQRPPTDAELDSLIREHVREEIYYREALALGLDRDDTIVRRRLRQKLEFLSEDIMAMPEPSEDELSAYLQANADLFRIDAQITFEHVYLNTGKRAGVLEVDAQKVLDRLRNGELDPGDAGEPFLFPMRYEAASEREIRKVFGSTFIEPLMNAPARTWHGPVPSGYGVHLVYISERVAGRAPSLDEVRDLVVPEWSDAKRKELNEAFYARLQDRYTITVEKTRQRIPREVAKLETGT